MTSLPQLHRLYSVEWWIGKDVKSGCGPVLGTIPAFSWSKWEKSHKKNLRISDLWAETQIWDLQNMKEG
jgi:hypothetical protein